MFSLIITPNRADQVHLALSDNNISYNATEILDITSVQSVFQSAARVMAETLILDVDVAGTGVDLVDGVKTYRIQRPQTRIILLAPDREPGDLLIRQLVGLGVYDIVASESESDWTLLLSDTLKKPPGNFAQAARWYNTYDNTTGSELAADTQRIKDTEKVIIERRPLGSVTIAVAGAGPGVGTTHIALSIAAFLSKNKQAKVVVVELSKRPGLNIFSALYKAKTGSVEYSFKIASFDVISAAAIENLDQVYPKLRNVYEYIIIDLGFLNDTDMGSREFSRANFTVIVCSAAPWRWTDLGPYIDSDEINILLNMPIDKYGKTLQKYVGLNSFDFPYTPDPLQPVQGEEILEKLLYPIIATKLEQKPFWKRLFK